MAEPIAYVLLVLPLAWSAMVARLGRLAPGNRMPDDTTEKYQLLIMVTPILLGALWLALPRFVSMPLPLPRLADADGSAVVAQVVMTAKPVRAAAIYSIAWFFPALLAVWAAGTALRLLLLILALMRLGDIAKRAGLGEIDGVAIRLTDVRVPPLAWGRSTIVLPKDLAAKMAPEDLRLIIRHEQAHLGRGDPFYFAALSALDAVAWFNPFLRAQIQRCRLAAELACDGQAMGKNPVEREAYARVLIQTLKHTAGAVQPHAPAVISNVKSGDYRMRLGEIMHAAPSVHKPGRRWLYATLAVAVMPVAALQFAWAQGTIAIAVPVPAPVPSPVAARPAAAAIMQMPMAGEISSPYGRRKDPKAGVPAFHNGIDIAAPVGTDVMAPANGRVEAIYSDAGDGKVVEIEYAGGLLTRMTHLDTVKVKWGDHVTVGQVVARSGNTGESTGPHLHFEVRRHGKTIDPASVLPSKAN